MLDFKLEKNMTKKLLNLFYCYFFLIPETTQEQGELSIALITD